MKLFFTRIGILALVFFLIFFPLYSADFYERLTPEGRQLYESLDEEHKRRAVHLGENMPNANQATFLAAQEMISHKQGTPPYNAFNIPNSEPKQKPMPYFPSSGSMHSGQNLPSRALPYVQTPNIMRH